jgi:glycosyltransferase involved in cell wall biosynthesis
MALVSIIIPCFNAAPFIARCLQSCFNQIHENIEIILVDNNSTDESIAIARYESKKAKKDISIVECKKQGQKYARSLGNKMARGKYIQLLDADDELSPDKIASQIAALNKYTDYSVAYCDWRWRFHQTDGNSFTVGFRSKQFDDHLLQLLLDNWHPPHVYFYQREVVEKINPIYSSDCKTVASEDREFISLAALQGARFLHVAGPFVYYNNWSSQQITHRVKRAERAKSLEQIFGRLNKFAKEQSKVDFKEIHWWLLGQSWNLFKLVPGRIAANSTIYETVKQGRKVSIDILPLEATVLDALQKYSGAFWLEHHARQILRILHLKAFHALGPNLHAQDSFPKIINSVNRLLMSDDEDIKRFTDLYSFEQDQTMDIPKTLSLQFLLKGPLYLPTFVIQRLFILQVLHRLCDKGILVQE